MSRYYDSLLAKVIASAPTFKQAAQKMHRALGEFQVRLLCPEWLLQQLAWHPCPSTRRKLLHCWVSLRRVSMSEAILAYAAKNEVPLKCGGVFRPTTQFPIQSSFLPPKVRGIKTNTPFLLNLLRWVSDC